MKEENQLTLLEKFEDALEDVDQAIQDTMDDFESINGLPLKQQQMKRLSVSRTAALCPQEQTKRT